MEANPSSISPVHVISTIEQLPQRLRLVSLSKESVPAFTHTLLNALFFCQSGPKFISYTETNEEISLIVDEETFKIFPLNSVQVSEEFWRAFQFSLGSSPLETGGLVSIISAPLGRAGISIFFLTTFNCDFILVQESKFQEAKTCLKANFPIVFNDEDTADSQHLDNFKSSPQSLGPSNIIPESFSQLQALPDLSLCLTWWTFIPKEIRAKLFSLSITADISLFFNWLFDCFFSIEPHNVEMAFRDLVHILFFGERSYRFISFTQTTEEVSLIMDEQSLSSFPREKLEIVLSEPWIPIKRLKKRGFSETGVVSAIAEPLASLNMLYMSSFQTGWVLVKKDDFSTAVKKLEEKGFVISSGLNFTKEL